MSKVSKTARASAGMVVREAKVIPDEVYIKNLRNDLESGLYVAQEGARALLRAYDESLASEKRLTETLAGSESTLCNKVIENEALYKNNQSLDAELQAALAQITTLAEELEAAHGVSKTTPSKYDGAGDFGTHRAYDDHN